MIGKGTTLGFSAVPPTTYTPIGTQVVDVNKPGMTWDDVETTHYTTTGGIKSFIAGWAEGDVVNVEVNHVAADETVILGLGGLAKTFKITLPDTSSYVFPGYVNQVGGSVPNKDVVKTTLSIKITGA